MLRNPDLAETSSYVQEGYVPPEDPRIPQELWEKIRPLIVKACVDIVLVVLLDGEWKMIIGKRMSFPHKDWWVIGGRIFVTDFPLEEAVRRKLEDEIGLQVSLDRIPKKHFPARLFKWKDESGEYVDLGITYMVKVKPIEWEMILARFPGKREFSEMAALPPAVIATDERYHPDLRKTARQVMEELEIR